MSDSDNDDETPVDMAAAMAAWRRWDPKQGPFRGYVKGVGPAPLVCPHCGVSGQVTSRQTSQKVGVSGGKATAALLTGGLSLLVPGVGLSRKVQVTQRHCTNCGSDWTVA